MKKATPICAIAALVLSASTAIAGTMTADWTGFTALTATGSISGIDILATTTSSSPFEDITSNRFVSGGSGGWDTAIPLTALELGLLANNVNAGDQQVFDFSSPFSGFIYIDNFDSRSRADITAVGATSLSLTTGSPSISFTSTGTSTGTLSTSNSTFDGEGDAVVFFTGPVSSIQLDYTDGIGANGIFYTFAEVGVALANIPEPSTASLMLTAALGMIAVVRRHG